MLYEKIPDKDLWTITCLEFNLGVDVLPTQSGLLGLAQLIEIEWARGKPADVLSPCPGWVYDKFFQGTESIVSPDYQHLERMTLADATIERVTVRRFDG